MGGAPITREQAEEAIIRLLMVLLPSFKEFQLDAMWEAGKKRARAEMAGEPLEPWDRETWQLSREEPDTYED